MEVVNSDELGGSAGKADVAVSAGVETFVVFATFLALLADVFSPCPP